MQGASERCNKVVKEYNKLNCQNKFTKQTEERKKKEEREKKRSQEKQIKIQTQNLDPLRIKSDMRNQQATFER